MPSLGTLATSKMTLVCMLLLVCLFIVNLVAVNRLTTQSYLATENPSNIASTIGNAKADVSQMRSYYERLAGDNSAAEIEAVTGMAAQIDTEMQQYLSDLQASYQGPQSDVDALAADYANILAGHNELVAYVSDTNNSLADIAAYMRSTTDSLYLTFATDADVISSYDQTAQASVYSTARSTRLFAIIFSVILTLAIAALLFISTRKPAVSSSGSGRSRAEADTWRDGGDDYYREDTGHARTATGRYDDDIYREEETGRYQEDAGLYDTGGAYQDDTDRRRDDTARFDDGGYYPEDTDPRRDDTYDGGAGGWR